MLRAARAAWPALTIAVGLLVSIAATAAVSGGASALLVVRAAVLVVLLLSIASVLGAVAIASDPAVPDVRRGRLLDGAAAGAVVWTIAAAATAFLLYTGVAPDPSSPSFGGGLVTFLADVPIGRTWFVAIAAAAVLTAFLVAVRSRRGVLVLGLLSTASVLPVALQAGTTGAPIAVERSITSWTAVLLLALLTWIGAVTLGGPVRVLGAVCFATAGAATAVVVPDLVSAGALGPVGVAAALTVVGAGALSIGSTGARLPRGLRRIEGLLLAAGVALGVVASVSAPTASVSARTTPAEILTGAPLPPPLSVGALLASWRPDPLWVVVALALLLGHLVALRRRSGVRPARARAAARIAGIVLLVWLTNGGPAVYGELDLGVHLAQHLALLLLVPLLLAAGVPGLAEALAPSIPRMPAARPVTAALLAGVWTIALYATDMLRWSVADPLGSEATTGGCLVLGVLLAGALLHPGRSRRRAVACAMALLVAEAAGAAALGTGSSLLLADWFGAMGWGTDALAAQRLGALVAWPVAAVPTVALLVAAIRAPRAGGAALMRTPAVAA